MPDPDPRPAPRRSPRSRVPCWLLAPLLLAACEGLQRDEPLVLGVAGPIETGYGASMLRGAELAQAEINAEGGIEGRPLELRIRDDAEDRKRAIAVADELYRDPEVLAVVGHANSGTTTAAAEIYEQGLAAVATSATSPAISRLGDWIFRVATSDSANAVALAPAARDVARRAAILYENDDYGRGLAESFRSAFEEAGGEIVASDPFLPTTDDLTPYLERMRRRGVELVFLAALEEGGARAIRQAREVGLDARFLGGDGIEGLAGRGAPYEGTLVGLLYHPESSAAARAFAERYRAAYGEDPDSYAALGYDATRVLAAALRHGGADREGVREALARLGREDGLPAHPGATGTIAFDERGDPAGKEFAVGVVSDGGIDLVRDH